jgi:hypothetical protein
MGELADMLRDALVKGDSEELKKRLAELLPGQDVLPQDADALHDVIRSTVDDPRRLADLLRRAQGLPSAQELRGMRAQLEDDLQDLRCSNEGIDALQVLNTLGAAREAEDAGKFADTYAQMGKLEGFCPVLILMLNRIGTDNLLAGIRMYMKALAEDMISMWPSRNVEWLRRMHEELAAMIVSNTFVERMARVKRDVERAIARDKQQQRKGPRDRGEGEAGHAARAT